MKRTQVTIVLVLLLGYMLAGCSADRWASVEPGDYAPVQGMGPSSEAVVQAIQTLSVNRDEKTAVFTLVDGSELVVSFVPRDSGEWPAGCPSNIHSTYMEVLDIKREALTIGSLTFRDPILVRNCPPDPVRVALREDGEIGGGGSACIGADKCFHFGISSLPRSMKGYELYSWEEEGQWHFTLMTGTNRLKSVEEISSGENVVSEDGWVKISVIGVNGIKEVFNELPQGEEVVWISKQWREQTGDEIGGIALPPEKTIWDIQEHCDDLGLRLQIVK